MNTNFLTYYDSLYIYFNSYITVKQIETEEATPVIKETVLDTTKPIELGTPTFSYNSIHTVF